MTAGWTGSDLAAGDVAWDAWHRLGVHPFRVAIDGDTPDVLRPLAEATETTVAALARQVLNECDVRLYGEARERVVAAVQRDVVHHVLYAVVSAVSGELMRPEPEPYVPPPVGSWVRGRYADRGVGPRWDGRWHRFTGDLTLAPARLGRQINTRYSRAACGARVRLRDTLGDAAIAETMPAVEACRRCARARATV